LVEYFYTITVIQDNDIRQVLPDILKGLKSDNEDYRATTQLLVSALSRKVIFGKEIIDELVDSCIKGGDHNFTQSLLCLITLFRTQRGEIRQDAAWCLLKNCDAMINYLTQISINYNVDSFILPLANSMIDLSIMGNKNASNVLLEIFRIKEISSETIKSIIRNIFSLLSKKHAKTLLLILEKVKSFRFKEIDSCINEYFSSEQSKDEKTYKLISNIFNGTISCAVTENTTLFLGLQHSESEVRLMSINKLNDLVQSGKKDVIDDIKTFIAPILLNLIQDIPKIAVSILRLKGLFDLVDSEELAQTLSVLIIESDSIGVRNSALYSLLNLSARFPETITIERDEIIRGAVLTVDHDIKSMPVFIKLIEYFGTPDKVAIENIYIDELLTPNHKFFNLIAFVLEIYLKKIKENGDCITFLTGLTSNIPTMRILCCFVLNGAIKRGYLNFLSIYEYLTILEKNFKWPGFQDFKVHQNAILCSEGFPSKEFLYLIQKTDLLNYEKSVYLHSLACVINFCQTTQSVIWQCPKKDHLYEKVVFKMVKCVLTGNYHKEELIKLIITRYCLTGLLEFCFAGIYVETNSAALKCTLLGVALVYLEKCASSKSVKDFQLVIPSLMIALSDESKSVRTLAARALSLLKKSYEAFIALHGSKQKPATIYGYDNFYGKRTDAVQYLSIPAATSLVDYLIEKSQEMIADNQYLTINLSLILKSFETQMKKNKTRDEVLKFLVSNVIANSERDFRALLLQVVAQVNSTIKVKSLNEVLVEELNLLKHISNPSLDFLELLIGCFGVSEINNIFVKSTSILNTFCDILSKYETLLDTRACQAALNVITPEWFKNLALHVQQNIFGTLINTSAFCDSNILSTINQCLTQVSLNSKILIPKLQEFLNFLSGNELQQKRHKGEDTNKEQNDIFVLISFLEFLKVKCQNSDFVDLVPQIALLLDGLLNFPPECFMNIEYAKQLILSTLDNILSNSKTASELIDESLRADLVIQCIRVTDNPQTHNAALLLLATMGRTHSSVVLLNIMPVFTFMGANILRQDDNYSFHVVQQTLETIIPSLLESGEEEKLTYVKNVLDIFVNAIQHVPSHRRLRLFTILAQTVGEHEYLGALIVLLIASPVIASEKIIIQSGDPVNVKKFSMQLLTAFERPTQLEALSSILEIVKETPDFELAQGVPAILDTSSLQVKTIRLIKIHAVQFVNLALKQILSVGGVGFANSSNETLNHMNLIEKSLLLIEDLNKKSADCNNESVAFSKYSRIMLDLFYENLSTINSMLSVELFLEVLDKLLTRSNIVIQKKSMSMFEDRVKIMDPEEAVPELFDNVTNTICKIFKETSDDDDVIENKQHALLCLGVLVSLLGAKKLDKYSGIMEMILSKQGLEHPNPAVHATAMIALSPFIRVLETRTIPYLQKLIPFALQHIRKSIKSRDSTSLVVLKSSFTCINAAVDSIPKFMSSFISELVLLLADPSFILIEEEEIQKSSLDLIDSLCSCIEHRVLFPIIAAQISPLMKLGSDSLLVGVTFLRGILAASKQNNVMEIKSEWLQLFLEVFDYRNSMKHMKLGNTIIEEALIDLFTAFTLKTNEKSFKPIFLKIVEWGTDENDENRMSFIFKLVISLLTNLKSIFVPFFSFILDSSLSVLNQCLDNNEFTSLWKNVMGAFLKCFTFDTVGFISKERFDKIVVPLTNQLEVNVDSSNYQTYMNDFVIPTIGLFAKACLVPGTWKQLNKIILMKTRSESASVRWAALSAISELYKKLGEEMLVFFPETIPFLAELLEDNDGQVESLCKDVCLQIQQYLGEPIEQYFTS
jgi:hypothetical protein